MTSIGERGDDDRQRNAGQGPGIDALDRARNADDALPVGHQQRQSLGDAERAERGDERRNAERRDQHAVAETEAQSDGQRRHESQATGEPVAITVTASTMEAKVSTAPIDRSRPSVMMMTVIGSASISRMVDCVRMLAMLAGVVKPGLSHAENRAQHDQHDRDARHARRAATMPG